MSDFSIAANNARGYTRAAIVSLEALEGTLAEIQDMADAEAGHRGKDREEMQERIRVVEQERDGARRERDEGRRDGTDA